MGIVAIIILLPWGMRGLGYYVDNTGGEIGRLAAGKRMFLCVKKSLFIHIFGPSTVSRRRECVYTYASLTKDPSACELLMPSDYGFSCLGEVEGKLFSGEPCYYSAVRKDVYCNTKYSEGELSIDNPQIENVVITNAKICKNGVT